MTHKFLKSTMIGACVFVTLCISVFVIYGYYTKFSLDTPAYPSQASVAANSDVSANDNGGYAFVARLTNNTLSVFAVTDNKEEFLYTLDIRIQDISLKERAALEKGVPLKDGKALAAFEEDFTS